MALLLGHSTHYSLASLGPVYFWKLSYELAPDFYYSSKPKVAFVRTGMTYRGGVQLDIGYLSIMKEWASSDDYRLSQVGSSTSRKLKATGMYSERWAFVCLLESDVNNRPEKWKVAAL